MVWYELEIEIEPAAREAVEYALMEAGALGTVTGSADVTVAGYFSEVPDRELIRSELFEALRIYNLPSSSVRDMNLREVENRDWLEEWKKNWQPVEIGRFVIAPPWTKVSDAPDRIIIRIEPGMAFGTGTHETTRLCLDAIQKHFSGGSFLDVGTGTGILAIAAAKMFPDARIEACDTDAEAIEIARENAAANNVEIEFRVGSVEETTPSADLVCANLTADVILQILPALIGVTCGKLILSGILETQVEQIVNALPETEITQDGEWVAIVV
ncbi:MAG TPA: 50S ribosomal protein L11 methyltransferase [Pyrinomonadaceae bacterium]|nr:50S ribosomal protein L11 methyltransferase [Pyrinomonadaceae bacterium]